MKLLIGLVTLSFLITACCETKQPTSIQTEDDPGLVRSDSAAIVENFNKQVECWNNHDIECYAQAYYPSEKSRIISGRGVTKGHGNILKAYKNAFPEDKMGQLDFDNFTMQRLSNEFYYVVGRYNLKYEEPDSSRSGWFSILMEKKDSTWYIVSDHSS